MTSLMALLLSQSPYEHDQLIHLWKLSDWPKGNVVTTLYRHLVDITHREDFLGGLPAVEQAVFRMVEAQRSRPISIALLRGKLPFDEVRIRQALAMLRAAGLLLVDGASVCLPDEFRARRSQGRIGSNLQRTESSGVQRDITPASITAANDAWLADVLFLLRGDPAVSAAVRIGSASKSFPMRFASVLRLVDGRRRPTGAAALWLSSSKAMQEKALFEFWLSYRNCEDGPRRRFPNLPRVRQRLCAALRGGAVGVWHKPPSIASLGLPLLDLKRRAAGASRPNETLILGQLQRMSVLDLGYDTAGRLIGVRVTACGGRILAIGGRASNAGD